MSDRIARHARRRRPAARRARGDLRAPGQAVRGRLHRHLQPAARRRSRTAACGWPTARSSPRRCPTASPRAEVQLSVRPEKLWIDELEDGHGRGRGRGRRARLPRHRRRSSSSSSRRARGSSRSSRTRRAPAPTTAGSWATACASAGSPSTRRSCAEPRRPRARRRARRPRGRARPRRRRRRRAGARGARPAGRARRAGGARRRPRRCSSAARWCGAFHTAYLGLAGELGLTTEPSYVAEPGADELGPAGGRRAGRVAARLHGRPTSTTPARIEAALVRAGRRRSTRTTPGRIPTPRRWTRSRSRRWMREQGARPAVLRAARAGRARAGGRLGRSGARCSACCAWSPPPGRRSSTAPSAGRACGSPPVARRWRCAWRRSWATASGSARSSTALDVAPAASPSTLAAASAARGGRRLRLPVGPLRDIAITGVSDARLA